jgi:hypothetical protein
MLAEIVGEYALDHRVDDRLGRSGDRMRRQVSRVEAVNQRSTDLEYDRWCEIEK